MKIKRRQWNGAVRHGRHADHNGRQLCRHGLRHRTRPFVGGDFAINTGASFTIAEWVLGVTSNGVGLQDDA